MTHLTVTVIINYNSIQTDGQHLKLPVHLHATLKKSIIASKAGMVVKNRDRVRITGIGSNSITGRVVYHSPRPCFIYTSPPNRCQICWSSRMFTYLLCGRACFSKLDVKRMHLILITIDVEISSFTDF